MQLLEPWHRVSAVGLHRGTLGADIGRSLAKPDAAREVFYGDCPDDVAAAATSHLVTQETATFTADRLAAWCAMDSKRVLGRTRFERLVDHHGTPCYRPGVARPTRIRAGSAAPSAHESSVSS